MWALRSEHALIVGLLIACTADAVAPSFDATPWAHADTTPPTAPVPTVPFTPSAPAPVHPGPRLVPRRTVVVGGGPSGMAAAMDLSGEVVLVEALDTLGGRGAIAGGQALFPASDELRAAGLSRDPDELLSDWEALTGAPPTAATAAWLDASEGVHDRLRDLGVVWGLSSADPILSKWYVHFPEGAGGALTDALAAALPDTVDVRLGTRVTGLRLAEGRVTGVDTDAGPILADTVVIATGGFVNRVDLLEGAVDDELGTFRIGTDGFAQGDALDWADTFGLGTSDLGAVGWSAALIATPGVPTGPIRLSPGFVVPWFWVDETGRRFVDETQLWSVLLAGKERTRAGVWAVGLWERWVGALVDPADLPALEAARDAGDAIRCDPDPKELADRLGVDAEGLAATFVEVEEIRLEHLPDPFGRPAGSFSGDPGTVCAYRVGHQALKGFGGLAVTDVGQVLDRDARPVPGLWSVGEAAGMAVPGMGGLAGWDGSLSAVVWSGWRTAAAINAGR